MDAMATLLRLAQRDLEAARLALGEAEATQRELEGLIAAHDEAVASEQKLALASYEGARAYGGFAAAAIDRRRALEARLMAAAAVSESLRADVMAAHVEVRKFERLIELKGVRAAALRERADMAALDEAATLRAARRGAGGEG